MLDTREEQFEIGPLDMDWVRRSPIPSRHSQQAITASVPFFAESCPGMSYGCQICDSAKCLDDWKHAVVDTFAFT